MKFFTRNPLEGMMQTPPRFIPEKPASLPETHPCHGCGCFGRLCFALCHRQDKFENAEKSS
jgi:hypothetical protein